MIGAWVFPVEARAVDYCFAVIIMPRATSTLRKMPPSRLRDCTIAAAFCTFRGLAACHRNNVFYGDFSVRAGAQHLITFRFATA